MKNQTRSQPNSSGKPRTPARPLYAARLPPIQQHPLGAPNSGKTDLQTEETPQSEPIITTTSLQSLKIRPTMGKPIGTQLSARSGMTGGGVGLKPLPAIGEPYKRLSNRSRNAKKSPLRTAIKAMIIVVFLSIPVIIFIIMMILSGGFAPTTQEEDGSSGIQGLSGLQMSSTGVPSSVTTLPTGDQTQSIIKTTSLRPPLQDVTQMIQ